MDSKTRRIGISAYFVKKCCNSIWVLLEEARVPRVGRRGRFLLSDGRY